MLNNYSVLLPSPASPLEGRDTSECEQICSHVPSAQVTSMPNGHLPVSRASLAASKADSAGSIIDWLVQLCPPCDLQTSYFPSRCISSLSVVDIWKVWTWPGRWESSSNYGAIQWERALRDYSSDLVKLMVGNKSVSPNEGSGVLKVGACSCTQPRVLLANKPHIYH